MQLGLLHEELFARPTRVLLRYELPGVRLDRRTMVLGYLRGLWRGWNRRDGIMQHTLLHHRGRLLVETNLTSVIRSIGKISRRIIWNRGSGVRRVAGPEEKQL